MTRNGRRTTTVTFNKMLQSLCQVYQQIVVVPMVNRTELHRWWLHSFARPLDVSWSRSQASDDAFRTGPPRTVAGRRHHHPPRRSPRARDPRVDTTNQHALICRKTRAHVRRVASRRCAARRRTRENRWALYEERFKCIFGTKCQQVERRARRRGEPWSTRQACFSCTSITSLSGSDRRTVGAK